MTKNTVNKVNVLKKRKQQTAIRILIKANEFIRCEQLYKNIANKLPAGITTSVFYLPKELYIISLQKSAHGYGAHRRTFGFDTYKMCLNIGSYEPLNSDIMKQILSSIHEAKALPGVSIKIQYKFNANA